MSKQLTAIGVLIVVATFVGCGSAKRQEAQEAREKQGASIAEMKRVLAAFGDLQIALNAGVSVQEFSQRTNDTLIKIGDLQRSEGLAESGFPTAEAKVAEIYVHFDDAAKAYGLSKHYFGPNPGADSAYEVDLLSNSDHDMIESMFPDMARTTAISLRSETVKGLWRVAKTDTTAAGNLIDQLSTPAS